MGVCFDCYCLEKRLIAPEIGDQGYFGYPSLAISQDKSPNNSFDFIRYSFGWLYDGINAISLIPNSIEMFRSFLLETSDSTLVMGMDYEINAVAENIDIDEFQYYYKSHEGFVYGRYQIKAVETGEIKTSKFKEKLKFFETRYLLEEEISRFLTRINNTVYDSIYHAPGIVNPDYDLKKWHNFINKKKKSTLEVSIVDIDTNMK